MVQIVSSETTQNNNQQLAIVDVTAGVDTDMGGIIPLGQIPDERISLSTTVKNTADTMISGIRIRSFLVRQGREDEISLQLGSDLRTVDLNPGEMKTFSNGYMISKKLRPGPYKVLLYVDSNISSDISSSDAVKYISDQVVSIGAYVAGQGSVPVYSPNKITTPGTYVIMRDIQGGDAENIFRITTSGVTIDGKGHTIRGISNGYTAGIYVDGQSNLYDITIKNCIFEDIDFGVWFYRVSNGKIIDCTFRNCKVIGLRLDQSQSNTISGNTLTGNELGIGIFQSSGNVISNNYFKNKFNAAVNAGIRNSWNQEPEQGMNIIGGSSIAGNAWFDLNGGGYSVTNPDSDIDGIADSPFIINAENIDYYPLSVFNPPTSALENTSQKTTGNASAELSMIKEAEEQEGERADEPNASILPPSPEPSHIQATTPAYDDSADLRIIAVEIPDTACSSENIAVNITIENIGTLKAEHFSICYFLSQNPKGISLSDTEIGSHLIERLEPGGNRTVTDTLTIPSKMSGLYTIGAIIDPAQDIYEKNTRNNDKIADHQIQITGC